MKLLDQAFLTKIEATVISKPAKMKAILAATFIQKITGMSKGLSIIEISNANGEMAAWKASPPVPPTVTHHGPPTMAKPNVITPLITPTTLNLRFSYTPPKVSIRVFTGNAILRGALTWTPCITKLRSPWRSSTASSSARSRSVVST